MNPGHYIGILSYLYAPVDKKVRQFFCEKKKFRDMWNAFDSLILYICSLSKNMRVVIVIFTPNYAT